MDDERIVISSSAAIAPEAVAGKGFTTSMRGYQPAEVRQFLNRVADELAAAVAREAELRRELHDALTRAAHPELDESVLTSSLGEHAGRLIASARETAAAITAEAERTAAATLRDAEFRIARIRGEADTLMARRVDEADGVSASLRQSAEADARSIRDQAQAEAEAAIQAARSHGKEMVAEARAVRERMLGDLARRRRVAEVQLEQLRVARGRMVEAYEVVRRTLEEVTAELAAAEPEARLAAEAVGRRMSESDLPPSRIPDPPPPGAHTLGSAPPPRRPEVPHRTTDEPVRPALAAFAPTAMPPGPGDAPDDHPAPGQQVSGQSGGGQPGGGQSAQGPPSSEAAHGGTRPMPAPAASGYDPRRPGERAPDVPPVPAGWIERAGGSAGAAGRNPPPMPPSVAAPLLVPAAGIGGGAQTAAPAAEPDPADPGTWVGAGFGPPRDGTAGRPSDPPTGSSHQASSDQASSDQASSDRSSSDRSSSGHRPVGPATTADFPDDSYGRGRSQPPGSPPAPTEAAPSGPGAAVRPPPDPSSGSDRGSPSAATPAELTPGALAWLAAAGGTPPPSSGSGHTPSPSASRPSGRGDVSPARFPAPTRPPLRPQTVADSRPFRGQAAPSASSSSSFSGRAATSLALRPVPPDLPLEVPAARPEQPPELATAELPVVAADPGAAPVDDLFARLRNQVPGAEADRRPPAPAPSPASTTPSDAVVDETALAGRDQQLDPLDADLTRALKRILQDEQNEVLEGLRQGGRAGVATLVAALDPQKSGFRVAAAPALTAAYRAGGGAADDQTGATLGARLAHDLVTPLRARLQRVVASAGDDMEELAEAVRAAYRHAKLQEIEQLVRHHTAAAHALGAFSCAGTGTTLRWVVDDEGPCPDCHDNALAGPTPRGAAYPTGQKHPPAHLGCRCLLVPAAT